MHFPVLVVYSLLAQTGQPPTIDLQEALSRAKKYAAQVEFAGLAAEIAREDRKQAKANALLSLDGLNQFIYTEGNGTASGVYVGADGVPRLQRTGAAASGPVFYCAAG